MPRKPSKKDISNLWLLPILLVGIFFRIYNNTSISLWHDEAFSALYIRDYSWSEMMYRIGLDVHPPLYYWILRVWSYVFGDGLASLRGMSVLFGVLTVWAGYMFVKKSLSSQRLALFAALLIAINPFQAQYSLEARMYTLGTFLLLLSSYWLLRALESQKYKDWIIYAVLVAGMFYTHYFLIFSAVAQGLYVIYWLFKNKKIKFRESALYKSLGSYLLVGILYVPWLRDFLIQRGRVQESYWIPKMDEWSIPSTIWKMIYGGQGISRKFLVVACIVSLVIFILYFVRIKRQEKWLIALSLFVPFLASILLSLQTAIYLDRYFVFTSLFFTIMIAAVIDSIPRIMARRILASIFIAMLVFTFFKNWYDMDVKNMFFDRNINKKPGIAPAAAIINEYAREDDKIYVGSSFIYFTYKYYNQTGIAPRLISSGPLSSIPHFSGTALLKDSDLILTDTIFNNSEVERNDNVWLVWTTGFGSNKPNVPGNWSTVAEYSYQDAPGYKGNIFVTQYHVN